MISLLFRKLLSLLNGGGSLIAKLQPFLEKWEGGLSNDPYDKAASYPSPWNGYHTNKGVTYKTFKTLSPKLGYAVTKDNFLNMPNHIWIKIVQHYADSFPLDRINHLPSIQAVIITWAWGSGAGGAERHLANWMRANWGIQDSDITPSEIVEHFNKRVNAFNQKAIFNQLCDDRARQFRTFSTWSVHGKGWMNRLNDFRSRF